MLVMMVITTLVLPVYSRPHQAQNEIGKIENAVSESLKEIEAALMGSAKKIENAIEETISDKMAETADNMEHHSNEETIVSDSVPAEADIKKNAALKYHLGKLLAARKAAALKDVAASLVSVNGKVAEGETTTTSTTTTTTLDPWDEYCKEACEAGTGGPECDCPDHPIG